jgi:hypothetical protein
MADRISWNSSPVIQLCGSTGTGNLFAIGGPVKRKQRRNGPEGERKAIKKFFHFIFSIDLSGFPEN